MSAEDVPVVRSVYDSQPWLSRPSTVNGVRELEGDSRNFQRALFSSSFRPGQRESLRYDATVSIAFRRGNTFWTSFSSLHCVCIFKAGGNINRFLHPPINT